MNEEEHDIWADFLFLDALEQEEPAAQPDAGGLLLVAVLAYFLLA